MMHEKARAFLRRHRAWVWMAAPLLLVALTFWLIWAQPWRVFLPNNGYRYVVGVSQQAVGSSRQIALKRALQAAAAGSDQLNLLFGSADDDAAVQARQIEAMMRQRVDAIIVDTSFAAELHTTLDDVRAAGIPLVLIGDESMTGAPCDLLLIYDYAQMGRLAGAYFSRMPQETVRLLEVQGMPRSAEAKTLQAGLRQGLARHGEVVCVIAGYHSRAAAGQRIKDSVPATSPFDIHAVFAHDTEMAFGALDSLDGLPVVCVQYDDALAEQADSPFDVVVLAHSGGAQAMQYVMDLLRGKDAVLQSLLLPAELKILKGVAE